jgi:hypothetical protein
MKKLLISIACALLSTAALAHDLTAFGGACDGVTDNTPALNAANAAALASATDKTVNIPAGNCLFASQPNLITNGVSLIGQGKGTTVLIRGYSGNFLRLLGNGVRIENLSLHAGAGTSGGIGIEMVASNTLGAGGNHVLRHIWITSGSGATWAIPLGAWGDGRTIAPIGIRTIYMQDVTVFNATFQAMTWWHCHGCEWYGGGAYQGSGTTQQIVVGPGTNNRIDANYDKAAAIIYTGTMRN